MSLREHDLCLVERVEDMEDELESLIVEKEDIEYDAQDADKGSDEYEELEDEWEDVQEQIIELRGSIFKFKEAVVNWTNDVELNDIFQDVGQDEEKYTEEIKERSGDAEECIIRVRELTYGQVQRIRDDMMEESFEVDVQNEDIEGSPKSGFYQTEILKEAVIDWPEFAPSTTNRRKVELPLPGEYPVPVSEWLYERVNAYNTTGDSDMGNSSLEEALNSKE